MAVEEDIKMELEGLSTLQLITRAQQSNFKQV